MENVPDLIGVRHVDQFDKWCKRLEELGYKNNYELLNAKDYGIPQNRKRVFMVSVYGDFVFDMPLPIERKHNLGHMLEKDVEEKYFLSDKAMNKMVYIDPDNKVVGGGCNLKRYKNYITWKNKKGEFNTECNRASLEDKLCLTIATSNTPMVAIKIEERSDKDEN